jgi:hypothetical protein
MMRVLLLEGADRAIAETILVLPCTFMETVWGPLLWTERYEPVDEAYVADLTMPVLARAVRAAADVRGRRGPSRSELWRYARFTAALLGSYVIGSRVRLHVDAHGCALDFSEAVLTTEAKESYPFTQGL